MTEEGQVMPLLVFILAALLLMAAMVVDVGRVYVVRQQLQATADASALGAASVGSCSEAVRLGGVNTPGASITCTPLGGGRFAVTASQDLDATLAPGGPFHVERSATATSTPGVAVGATLTS